MAYAELTRSWRLAYADLTRVCLLRKCTAQQAYAELTRDLRPSLLWRKPSAPLREAYAELTRPLRQAYAAILVPMHFALATINQVRAQVKSVLNELKNWPRMVPD